LSRFCSNHKELAHTRKPLIEVGAGLTDKFDSSNRFSNDPITAIGIVIVESIGNGIELKKQTSGYQSQTDEIFVDLHCEVAPTP
jgi:hypothetical protein